MVTIIRTDSDNPEFRALVSLLDANMREVDGEDHTFYKQFNKIDTIKYAVVAFKDNQAVGCGAIRQYDAESIEIKRMYVLPAYRKQGIAGTIVSALEIWAKELGFTTCILETGKRMPEAISLYKKAGYTVTPNYGQYIQIENSVCMRKQFSE